ncbi:glutathione S-transferase family protein [Hyphococcus sp.]|uniref:glutathione S-transferase family protein n=1 Tax=Hyphococcus sp. TaxID=2038636 RepID=UPI0035C6D917
MKLYDRQGTPNAARIRIVLAEKNLDDAVDFVTVDLIAAEQKQPAFLKMNPIGKTPVLELEDGLCISECTAITEYLDNLDGAPSLTGATPREKAVIHMMQRRVEIMLMEPIDDYFHYATPGLGAALKPWRMPDWAGAKDWAERRGSYAVANLPYWDGILNETPFLAGGRFSMPDITLLAALDFAKGAGLKIAPNLAALAGWRSRVKDLPAVKTRSGQDFLPEDISRRKQ